MKAEQSQQMLKTIELFLSDGEYDKRDSSIDIMCRTQDDKGSQLWEPFREGNLIQVF